MIPQTTFKYDIEVKDDGYVELTVPFPAGTHITVFVTETSPSDMFDDLLSAAQSNLDFWDNPFDDEDWNNA